MWKQDVCRVNMIRSFGAGLWILCVQAGRWQDRSAAHDGSGAPGLISRDHLHGQEVEPLRHASITPTTRMLRTTWQIKIKPYPGAAF
jgi:hypothetical protein